jgi:hypothetical protein
MKTKYEDKFGYPVEGNQGQGKARDGGLDTGVHPTFAVLRSCD